MSLYRDVTDLLTKEGFSFARMGSKHEIWSDGKHSLTVPSTPSDPRCLLNIRASIRKKRKGVYR